MIVFFKCVAEAIGEKGLRGLTEMVPGGTFAYGVAEAAWKKYRERKKDAEIREEIRQLAEATFEEARKAAIAAVKATALPSATAEEKLHLELYLTQVPGVTRASFRRPEDATGKTVPAAFRLKSADDLRMLLPDRSLRFKPNDPVPGLPDWSLVEPLGAGGFGEVWLARHRSMSSLCGAVKFCHGQQARDLKHESVLIDRVLSAGKHPNIVSLTNASLTGDSPWLMYEYVPGGDLAALVFRWRKMRPEQRVAQVLGALKQLTAAVSHFHKLNPAIVHRDLKPSNILVGQEGRRLLVTDFGIGAIAARAANLAEKRGTLTSTGRLANSLRGSHTPLYASPQQRAGADPDPRDDVHALGVIGYQLLTGQVDQAPGPDFVEELRDAGATEELISLLGQCVARDASKRPADAQELAGEVARLASSRSRTDEPPYSSERPLADRRSWSRRRASGSTESDNLARQGTSRRRHLGLLPWPFRDSDPFASFVGETRPSAAGVPGRNQTPREEFHGEIRKTNRPGDDATHTAKRARSGGFATFH